jgi:hypothetical protein
MEEPLGNAQGHIIGFHRQSDNTSINYSEMRGRDVLKKLINASREEEFSLRRAHNMLATDPNYASAMHAAASALKTQQINVFISYRMNVDGDLATTVAQAMRDLSGGKVSVTLSAEFFRNFAGKPFKEVISNEISRTHWFVLLQSDPKQNSDWCMFETGMFRASMISTGINRLICIYHPATPTTSLPDPISGFEAIPAEADKMMELFEGLFRIEQPMPGWDALNPGADEGAMRRFAERIALEVKGPSKPIVFNYTVTLDVEQPALLDCAEALNKCRIHTDPQTAVLFGFGNMQPPAIWGEFIHNVKRGGRQGQWLTELAAIIRKSCSTIKFRPISGTFECDQGGRMLRPVLESIEYNGASRVYHVRLIFVEDHCSVPEQPVSRRVLTFLNAHRINSRLRWELIERFVNADWDDGNQIDACTNVLSRIERDGQSFSQWDLDALCDNYPTGSRIEVRRIVERWCELRRTGSIGFEGRSGELDDALRSRDSERIRELVHECASLVSDFLLVSDPVMQRLSSIR